MLSKTSIQAIQALIELAKLPAGKCSGAGVIAKKIKAPQNYLGKLLQSLTDEGLVESQKGMGGGFRLARDPRRITLFDIVEPIERVSRWTGCVLGRGRCSEDSPCNVHSHWKAVRESYFFFLEKTSVADLADGK